MPQRKRASKSKIRVTLQDALALRGLPRQALIERYGSAEMVLAFWRAHRERMLAQGSEELPLPWRWTTDLDRQFLMRMAEKHGDEWVLNKVRKEVAAGWRPSEDSVGD
jgi:hypothetical protein